MTMRRMSNAAMVALLRSPAHRVVSRSLMALTVTGRSSGRQFTFPVQYALDGGQITVVVGEAARKTWWRNVLEPAPVVMRIRGREVSGIAHVVRDPNEGERALAAYARTFPRAARGAGILAATHGGHADVRATTALIDRMAIVRIHPTADLG